MEGGNFFSSSSVGCRINFLGCEAIGRIIGQLRLSPSILLLGFRVRVGVGARPNPNPIPEPALFCHSTQFKHLTVLRYQLLFFGFFALRARLFDMFYQLFLFSQQELSVHFYREFLDFFLCQSL